MGVTLSDAELVGVLEIVVEAEFDPVLLIVTVIELVAELLTVVLPEKVLELVAEPLAVTDPEGLPVDDAVIDVDAEFDAVFVSDILPEPEGVPEADTELVNDVDDDPELELEIDWVGVFVCIEELV